MSEPLDADILEEWKGMLSDSDRALAFYFDKILPLVLGKLGEVPEHRRLIERGCSTLVSTMGFSPETTVIAASVLRPKRLIVISSQANTSALDLAMRFLTENRILSFAGIRVEDVDPTDAEEIYEAIRRHFRPGDDDEAPIMDVTGGKKIMSATAAVAAWELKIPLCYVEGKYERALRRPTPGSERIILLTNPSQVRAAMLRDRALQWFERANMATAIETFRESRDAQTHHQHFDDFAIQLGRCELALMDLDFAGLTEEVKRLEKIVARPNVNELVSSHQVKEHLHSLRTAAQGDRLARVAVFRQLAKRYATQGRNDFACLLVYRTLEELVQIGLTRVSRTGEFDFANPDLELLADDVVALRGAYEEVWAQLDPGRAEGIPTKISLLAGLTLLCIASDLHQRLLKPRGVLQLLKHARGLSATRNHSILAHGRQNLTAKDVSRLQGFEEELSIAVLGDDAAGVASLAKQLDLPPIRSLLRR